MGLLEVNQKKKYNNDNYLLIEIMKINDISINSPFFLEIVVREYNEEVYFIPVDKYIIETFDDNNNIIRDKNEYQININQRRDSQVFIEFSPEYNDLELIFINKTDSTSYKCSDFDCNAKFETGFKKYIINKIGDDNIYFNIINPKKRKANFVLRYHYHYEEEDLLFNSSFYLNTSYIKNYTEKNDDNITLSLNFHPIEIIHENEPISYKDCINFTIRGLLYKKDEDSEELLNTTSILQQKIPIYENKTTSQYNDYKSDEFTLVFTNIPRNENFIYDLQILIYAYIDYYNIKEELLVFTTEVDLTDIKDESILWYILGPILGFIFILLVSFFVIKYIRLQKANTNLKEDLKSIAYSNEIQKNILSKEKQTSEKESDYDTTFI